MQLMDATRCIGRVGVLLPLILIFLAADSALACPEHTGRVAYRTKAVKTRTVGHMPTTVITYRAPASYRRCANNVYDTRGVSYTAKRGNGVRYVAVRGAKGYTAGTKYVSDVRYNFGRQRYGAVYDVDYGDARRYYSPRYVAVRRVVREEAPRYVAVRQRYPVYALGDGRYAEIRSGYRKDNGIVRYVDVDDDAPRYVAVRRHRTYDNGTRYVAVANRHHDVGRTKYVAVRNTNSGCARAVALRSCLDQIETTSARRVVLRNGYSTGAKYVAVRDVDYDDDEYITLPRKTKYVAVRDEIDDDEYIALKRQVKYVAVRDEFDDDDEEYVLLKPRTKYVAIRDEIDDDDEYVALARKRTYITYAPANSCEVYGQSYTYIPEAVSTRTISYVPVSYDDDLDDKAILDEGAATYVADDDIEDAYLSTGATESAAEEVGYVPVDAVEEGLAFHRGSDSRYIVTGNAAPHSIPYVALDEDRVFNDVDPAFIAANGFDVEASAVSYDPAEEVEAVEAETVGYVPADAVDYVDTETVSFVPVDDVDEDSQTVSYISVDDMDVDTVQYVPMDDLHVKTVSYLPDTEMNTETISYIPVESDDEIDTMYIVADECPMLISSFDSEPVYIADDSSALVEVIDGDLVAHGGSTDPIDGEFSYRDEFEDAEDAPLVSDV